MIDPTVSRLAERNMRGAASQQARPATLCPTHLIPLEGGPIRYRCPAGHAVVAADINREYRSGGAR